MALELSPALEQKLEHLAAQTHRSPGELAHNALEAYLADYEEQLAAVKEADEQFERGEFIPHEQVVAMFRERFAKV